METKTNEYKYLTLHDFKDVDEKTLDLANRIKEKMAEGKYTEAVDIINGLDKDQYDLIKKSVISATHINAIDEETRNLQIMCNERKQSIVFSGDDSSELVKTYIDYTTYYNPNTTYYKDDIVKYIYNSICRKYICIANNTKGVIPTNGSNWSVLVEKEYSSALTYNVNDLIVYGNCSYRCIKSNTNVEPTNREYWQPTCSEYDLMNGDVWISKHVFTEV